MSLHVKEQPRSGVDRKDIKVKEKRTKSVVGAAGFEPTITGSKPDALPLGYAPL